MLSLATSFFYSLIVWGKKDSNLQLPLPPWSVTTDFLVIMTLWKQLLLHKATWRAGKLFITSLTLCYSIFWWLSIDFSSQICSLTDAIAECCARCRSYWIHIEQLDKITSFSCFFFYASVILYQERGGVLSSNIWMVAIILSPSFTSLMVKEVPHPLTFYIDCKKTFSARYSSTLDEASR